MEQSKKSASVESTHFALSAATDPIGMVLLLADGKIQACNSAAEEILGFTLEQIQGQNSLDSIWQTIHEDGSPFSGETHPAVIALSTGQPVLGVVMGLYRPSGELIWLQIDGQPLFQAGETTPWAAIATFQDITAHRAIATVSPPPTANSPSQRTILLIDDCPEDQAVYRRYLERETRFCYRILVAETGAEALEICQRVKLDAVLLDYCLPDYEGLELLHVLSDRIPHVPVVLVTGQGTESLAVQVLKAGAEDYLIKNELTPATLQMAIADAIEKTELRFRLHQSQERERLVAQISQQVRQSLDLPTILNTTVEEVRQLFQTDRVLIFRFHPDWSGTIIAESVGARWKPVLSATLIDPCLATTYVEQYQQGRVSAIADIHSAEIKPCHVEMLAEFQVQANLVVPILQGDRLWGLLIAHHCAAPRSWQITEVELLQQLSTQVGTAIQQAELYQQSQIELAERQRIELELRDSERFSRSILDSTYDCVKVLNLNAQLLYMNPGGQRQMGVCDFSRIANCNWIEFWQGRDRQAAERTIATAKSGQSSRFEGFCPTMDGIPKWWEVQVSPMWDAAGNVERLLTVSRDITGRKNAETALKKSSDRVRLLYETVKELLISDRPLSLIEPLFHNLGETLELDLCLNYLLETPHSYPDCSHLYLASHFGLEDAIAQQWKWIEFGQGICGKVAQQRRQIVKTDLQNSTDSELALLRTMGMTAYISQPLIAQGKLFGTLAFGSYRRSHFTLAETELLQALCDQIAIALERVNLINSLQQQTEQLRQTDRLKDEFLAVLSHELRTPLNPILGWTRLMQTRRFDPPQMAKALETIERNAKLQSQLIEDLLDISRVMRGKLTLNAAPVRLGEVVTAALETVQLAAEAKHIQIETTIDKFIQQVSGDAGRLQQVVWNLLSNAVKFTGERGRIEVRLTQADHQVQLQVRDNGKGIDPNFIPYLFEYFRQEDGSTTRKFGGLGLGLAIARQIVELHGGIIWAESPGEGLGATFTLQLPGLATIEEQPAFRSAASLPELPLTGIRALVVDDDVDACDLISFLLENSGAIVTVTQTAAAALRAIEQSRPDVLLSDIGMPDMDGYDLIRAIRASEQGQPLPAIAITAYAGELNQRSAIAAGFQRHIAKPINLEQLILIISELCPELKN